MKNEMETAGNRDIWDIQPETLDRIMSFLFMNAKKIEKKSINTLGGLYQPDGLSSFRNDWQRVLSEKGYKALASRRKQLTQKGLGNEPLATRTLDDEEVNKRFECGYFEITNPLNLQRAMWWKTTIRFGYRARNE